MDVINAINVILGGIFTNIEGANFLRIARLNPDGSVDGSFLPAPGADQFVNALALQTDGKIVVAGTRYESFFGDYDVLVVRYNSDGSIDNTFQTDFAGGDDVGAPFRAIESLRQRAQIGEPLQRGRRVGGDVADGVVLEHTRAWHVARLSFALAPRRNLDQNRQFLRLAHTGLEPHPGAFRLGAVGIGGGQNLHLVRHPVGAAAPPEIGA